jgi:hypothetical protein
LPPIVTTAFVPNDDPDKVMIVPPEVGPGLMKQKTKRREHLNIEKLETKAEKKRTSNRRDH